MALTSRHVGCRRDTIVVWQRSLLRHSDQTHALQGDEAFLYHLAERGQESMDFRLFFDDLDKGGQAGGGVHDAGATQRPMRTKAFDSL